MVQNHFCRKVFVSSIRLCSISVKFKGSTSDFCTLWSWRAWGETTPLLFRAWINRRTISVLLSSCVRVTVTVNHSSYEDVLQRATEIVYNALYAFAPELPYGGKRQVQFKWPFMLFSLDGSLCHLHLSLPFLPSLCLFDVGLCVRLRCSHFGQWLWAIADHPRSQTRQHSGRLCRLLSAGWTGKSKGVVLFLIWSSSWSGMCSWHTIQFSLEQTLLQFE